MDIWSLINSVVIMSVLVLVVWLWKKQTHQLTQKLQHLAANNELLKQELISSQQALSSLEIQVVKHKSQFNELAKVIDQISLLQQSHSQELTQFPQFAQQLEQIHHLIQLIQSQSNEDKLYGRAKKMIEMGADVEELMAECGMARGEAELLYSMKN